MAVRWTAPTYANSGTDAFTTCTFDDGPSTHDVVARIIDKDGGYTEYTTTVTATNVPPTATLSNDGPVAEGSVATVSFTNQGDPSNADTAAGFHYAFACDGSSLDSATYANSNADASTTCTFDDGPSTHDVVARVIDKDGGYTEHTTTVTVTNVAPAATISAPSSVNEGDTFIVSLDNPTDPSSTDIAAGFTYTFNCGDGTGVQDTNTTASISCVVHDVASQTVTATITDKDGGTSSYSSVVTVNNIAPSVGAITAPVDPVEVNTSIDASASFTDPGIGLGDSHTASWDWGDGTTTSGAVTESTGSGSVTGSHTYTAAGVYTITLTVTDKDGESGSSTFQFVVVYDPSAGFVTGGGWINVTCGRLQTLDTESDWQSHVWVQRQVQEGGQRPRWQH